MQMTLVYITTPSDQVAEKIAEDLLEKKLIACANLHRSTSIYIWEGKREKAQEVIIIAKTSDALFDQIVKEVSALHPYKLPCIIKITADAHGPFKAWVQSQLKK